MIYIITHDKDPSIMPPYGGYCLLNVGKRYQKRTEEEKEINYLNPYLNEATGLYWIWKNTKEKYVGLNHYSRFFVNEKQKDFLCFDEIISTLESVDMIVGCRYSGVPLYTSLRALFPDQQSVLLLHKYLTL